jgi:hypothetical protein
MPRHPALPSARAGPEGAPKRLAPRDTTQEVRPGDTASGGRGTGLESETPALCPVAGSDAQTAQHQVADARGG